MSLKPPTEKQSHIIWLGVTCASVFALVVMTVALFWGLGLLFNLLGPLLWPLGAAGIIAYLLDPIVVWLGEKNISRGRAIALVFFLGASLLAAIATAILPNVVSEMTELAKKIPQYSIQLQQDLDRWAARLPDHRQLLDGTLTTNLPSANRGAGFTLTNSMAGGNLTNGLAGTNSLVKIAETLPLDKATVTSISAWLANSGSWVGSWLFGHAGKVSSWLDMLLSLILIPFYTFYFLLEKRGIRDHWKDYLPVRDSRTKDELVFVLDSVNQYLIAFFRGQILVALCNGILYGIGFFVIGLNYAILIGLAAVLLTIIPFVGAIIVCILAVLIAAVQYGDWSHPCLVLVVVAIVQSIESLIITPKIMGNRVGLHPMIIIVAVMTGTTLFGGLLGGLLAIPFAAALRVLMFRYIWKKRAADADGRR